MVRCVNSDKRPKQSEELRREDAWSIDTKASDSSADESSGFFFASMVLALAKVATAFELMRELNIDMRPP